MSDFIDRDLAEARLQFCKVSMIGLNDDNVRDIAMAVFDLAISVIHENVPAADVQPIVYAHKTINVGRRSYCSNCGKLAIMEDFCSKCGAKVKDGGNYKNDI